MNTHTHIRICSSVHMYMSKLLGSSDRVLAERDGTEARAYNTHIHMHSSCCCGLTVCHLRHQTRPSKTPILARMAHLDSKTTRQCVTSPPPTTHTPPKYTHICPLPPPHPNTHRPPPTQIHKHMPPPNTHTPHLKVWMTSASSGLKSMPGGNSGRLPASSADI